MNEITKDTIPAISHGPFTATPTGLIVTAPVPYEVWEAYGGAHRRVESSLQWVIGDWLVYGEDTYGEKYAQAMDETGLSYGYIANICSVASKIELEHRHQNLSFSHHATVAYLPPDQQDYWLATADNKGLNRGDLRDAIKGLPPSTEPEIIVTPKLSLRQVVATYVKATWNQDTPEQNKSFNKMVESVKDLL